MPVSPPPVREPGAPLVRPKEAATLIIYRQSRGRVEVFMGERHGKHRFMPQRYVFPGGRVDPTDSRVRVATPLREDVAGQLERKLTPARARAMAVAAVRETFEETGLIVGARDPAPERKAPAGWDGFFATGMAPALDRLDYVARAVTPPIRPVRFNARFFMVHDDHVSGDMVGSGELLNLRWLDIDSALGLELPMITGRVLRHIEEIVADPPQRLVERPVPNFVHTPDGHVIRHE